MLFYRRGERSLFVPKKFAFNEFRRYCRTVYLYVRHGAAVAFLVEVAGYEFLAGTVGTNDKYACVGRSYLLNHVPDMHHGLRFPDHLLSIDFFLENLCLLDKGNLVRGVLDGNEYPVEVQRFLDEIKGALLYAFYSRVDVSMTRNHHNGGIGSHLDEFVENFHPVHFRHLYVTEDNAVLLFFNH